MLPSTKSHVQLKRIISNFPFEVIFVGVKRNFIKRESIGGRFSRTVIE